MKRVPAAPIDRKRNGMKNLIYVVVLLMTGCQQSVESDVSGHYENQTRTEAEAIAGTKPKVIAEHAPGKAVIISLALIENEEFNRSDYGRAILETGVELLVVTDRHFNNGLANPRVSRFKRAIQGYEAKVRFVPVAADRPPTVWARDWGPIMAADSNNAPVALDFNYYPFRPAGDLVPELYKNLSPETSRLSVPVYNEGGNFMSNNRFECLMTSRVSDANSDQTAAFITDEWGNPVAFARPGRDIGGRIVSGVLHKDINQRLRIRKDDEVLTDDQIRSYYRTYAGCSKVTILPRMPYEGTGHIDMWAKFLDDDTIMINKISDDQIDIATDKETKKVTRAIQAYLQDRERDFTDLGYKVETVPMPVPQIYTVEKDGKTWTDFVMRSYTNSLFVINDSGSHALVPQYTTPDKDVGRAYVDAARIAGYEKEVMVVYEKYGYRSRFVRADDLIAAAGAVHCTTMQIAQ